MVDMESGGDEQSEDRSEQGQREVTTAAPGEPAPCGFSNDDLFECTAHGMLWFVDKIRANGDWGLLRVRRGGFIKGGKRTLVATRGLTWRKP